MNAIETTIDMPMAEVEAALRDALAAVGFGILTEIDIAATLKAKIGVDRPPLKILGACNPTLANQALQLDPSSSLLLPCNVVIEPADGGGTHIAIVDPAVLMPGAEFAELAGAAAGKFREALDSLAE